MIWFVTKRQIVYYQLHKIRWQNKDLPELKWIDDLLRNSKDLYPDIFNYDNSEKLASERFAYLGSMSGVSGLKAIHKPMQKYYKGIIK